MKTIREALIDEIYYPIPSGMVENIMIKRGINKEVEFTREVSQSESYIGALADCLCTLIQAISISEADKSITTLSDNDKKLILQRANQLYQSIGEKEATIDLQPKVYMGDSVWR